jgi:3-oxoacyl-[acyl-carrier protein] reductase
MGPGGECPREITVNVVAPGFTETDMNKIWLSDPQARGATEAYSVFSRIGQRADIADVVAFVASHEARWITRQTIDAMGGARL